MGLGPLFLPTLGGLGKPDQVAYLFELIMDNELQDLEQMIDMTDMRYPGTTYMPRAFFWRITSYFLSEDVKVLGWSHGRRPSRNRAPDSRLP